jgi:hypothetical protein
MEQKILKRIQELTDSIEANSKRREEIIGQLQLLDHDIRKASIALMELKLLLEPSEQP